MYGYDIFHEELLDTIISSIRKNKNPHAWIFSGDEGLGKHEAARLVANAIVCGEHQTAPCGTCKSCIMAKAGTHPDIKHVVPDGDKKTIGIDVIRNLNDDVFIKPFFSDKKVYIIDGDLMTENSQNGFLKTLEEPPLYAVFIILSSNADNLLQTIRSRCAIVTFPALSSEKLKNYLEKKYPQLSDSFKLYISFADGNPKRADMLIENEDFELLRGSCFEAVKKVLSIDIEDAFDVSTFFDKNKEQLPDIINIMMLFLRDMFLISNGFSEHIINVDYLKFMRENLVHADRLLPALEIIPICAEMNKKSVSAAHIGMYFALAVKTGKE